MRLSILCNHPRKCSCQNQKRVKNQVVKHVSSCQNQGILVSVHGSGCLAGHGHHTLLQATHKVAVPAITDQPVE